MQKKDLEDKLKHKKVILELKRQKRTDVLNAFLKEEGFEVGDRVFVTAGSYSVQASNMRGTITGIFVFQKKQKFVLGWDFTDQGARVRIEVTTFEENNQKYGELGRSDKKPFFV